MIATIISRGKEVSVKEVALTFRTEQQTLLEIQSFMKEVEAEQNQRKYGTLTPKELRQQFTN